MGCQLVPKVVSLKDLQLLDGRYFASSATVVAVEAHCVMINKLKPDSVFTAKM